MTTTTFDDPAPRRLIPVPAETLAVFADPDDVVDLFRPRPALWAQLMMLDPRSGFEAVTGDGTAGWRPAS